MQDDQTLNLSIGDVVPERRLSAQAWSGDVSLQGKVLRIDLSADAVKSVMKSRTPIIAELELYFSCLVRKQLRFREINGIQPEKDEYARVIPGLFISFKAVTTKHCAIADTGGKPEVENMPIQRAERFIPDWLKIDCRSGLWLGEYGFSRSSTQAP